MAEGDIRLFFCDCLGILRTTKEAADGTMICRQCHGRDRGGWSVDQPAREIVLEEITPIVVKVAGLTVMVNQRSGCRAGDWWRQIRNGK